MTAGNAINKRCVLCRDSKYIMSRPSALAAPIPLSSSHHISVLPILQMSLIWYQVLVATIDIDWHSLKIIVSPTKHQQQPSNQLRSVDLSVRYGWSKSVDLDFEKQFYNIRVTFPRTPGRQGEPKPPICPGCGTSWGSSPRCCTGPCWRPAPSVRGPWSPAPGLWTNYFLFWDLWNEILERELSLSLASSGPW